MTDRPYNTAVYVLRCLQIGLRPADLKYLNYGQVIDLMIEHGNDDAEWQQVATQEDFDRF